MKKSYDEQFKVVLVGSSGVGKSSLLIRFVDDEFKGDLLSTIGVDFRFRTVEVEGKKIKIQIWDTAGQDTFRTIISAYYKGADSIVILFDLNDPVSFQDVRNYWKQQIEENKEQYCKIMLIGNKCDLSGESRPSQQQISQLKQQLKTDLYFQTSAKSGADVTEAFTALSRQLLKKKANKSKASEIKITQPQVQNPSKKKCCKG